MAQIDRFGEPKVGDGRTSWRARVAPRLRRASLLLGLLAAVPGIAHAQASLDSAERQIEEAQFEQAAATLSEIADAEGPLDREDVARLLRLRAVVGLALGRQRAVRRDLLGLAAVLDGREPGPMPRNLAAQLDRAREHVRGVPRVRVRIDALDEGGMRAVVQLGQDPGALTRRTELVCTADGRELVRTEAADAEISALSEVRCEVTATGPGGWVMDTAEARRDASPIEVAGAEGPDFLLPAILGGAGAAVLIGVITGIVVATTAGRSVGGPEWAP